MKSPKTGRQEILAAHLPSHKQQNEAATLSSLLLAASAIVLVLGRGKISFF